MNTEVQNNYLEAQQEPRLIRKRQIGSYLVIFYVRLILLYSKSLEIDISSVLVKVPVGILKMVARKVGAESISPCTSTEEDSEQPTVPQRL